MTTTNSKKVVPFYVYEILKKHTDENNHLTQKSIEEKLRTEYDIIVERKSVRRYLQDLIDIGISISYTERTRRVENKQTGEPEEQIMMTNIYLERDFCDSELRLLIDALKDSDFIPTYQIKALISKLEEMAGPDFHKGRASVGSMTKPSVTNELFFTLGVIEEAINTGRKVNFKYKRYVYVDEGEIECKLDEYTVIPYNTQIVDGDSETSLRMDFITGIKFSNEYASRANHVNCKNTVVFETDRDMVPAFADQFGFDNIRVDGKGEVLRLSVLTDEACAENFALKYSAEVTVIAPESIHRKVSGILRAGWERYGGCAS